MIRATLISICSLVLLGGCMQTPASSKQQHSEGTSTGLLSSKPTANVLSYLCETNRTVEAQYQSAEQATITYNGKTHQMNRTVSASGERYTSNGLEWWTKANKGMLSHQLADGTSGDIIERCTQAQ